MDRTTYLNELDTKLEGKNLLLDDVFSDVKTLDVKLGLLYKHNSQKDLSYCPSCKTVFISSTSPGDLQTFQGKLVGIIQQLHSAFSSRFEDVHKRTCEI